MGTMKFPSEVAEGLTFFLRPSLGVLGWGEGKKATQAGKAPARPLRDKRETGAAQPPSNLTLTAGNPQRCAPLGRCSRSDITKKSRPQEKAIHPRWGISGCAHDAKGPRRPKWENPRASSSVPLDARWENSRAGGQPAEPEARDGMGGAGTHKEEKPPSRFPEKVSRSCLRKEREGAPGGKL